MSVRETERKRAKGSSASVPVWPDWFRGEITSTKNTIKSKRCEWHGQGWLCRETLAELMISLSFSRTFNWQSQWLLVSFSRKEAYNIVAKEKLQFGPLSELYCPRSNVNTGPANSERHCRTFERANLNIFSSARRSKIDVGNPRPRL